jgi:hypothetical protein
MRQPPRRVFPLFDQEHMDRAGLVQQAHRGVPVRQVEQ